MLQIQYKKNEIRHGVNYFELWASIFDLIFVLIVFFQVFLSKKKLTDLSGGKFFVLFGLKSEFSLFIIATAF